MRRHTLVRSAVAVVTAFGLAGAIAPLAAAPAFAADTPTELTIPAERTPDGAATVINGAGETGYLSGWAKVGFSWTSYADGSTERIVLPEGRETAWGTGTDVLVLTGKDTSSVVQLNMKDGTRRTVPLPQGQRFAGTFGDVVVSQGTLGMRVQYWEDGTLQEKAVSGSGTLESLYTGNKDGMLVQQKISGMTLLCWLGRDGVARSTHLTTDGYDNGRIEVGGDRLVQWTKDGKASVWKTSDFWSATDHLTIPGYDGAQLLGAVGDSVLVARRVSTGGQERYSSLDYRVVAVPLTGGPERVVLEKATAMARFKPDGTMLIGAVVDGHQGVYAVGSSLEATRVRESPSLASVPSALAVAQGRLTTVDRVPDEDGGHTRLSGIDLSVTGPLSAGPRTDRGADAAEFPVGGTPDIQATGDGRLVHRLADGTVKVLDAGAKLPARTLGVKADVLRVSGRYLATWRKDERVQVTDLDTGSVVHTGLSSPSFALSGSTLWMGDEPGRSRAFDVRTGRATGKDIMAPCLTTSLQAQGTDVYWECDRDKSGVYDTLTDKNTVLPAHEGALLGDGYVAWQKDGVLNVTDLHGTKGTHQVGKPAVAAPGLGWSVDRFGGTVAYVDAQGDTKVAPSGVAAAPVAALDTDFPSGVDAKSAARTARWWASKPLASWDLSLVNLTTRDTVRTATGGETRGVVRLDWDGKDSAGRDLTPGRYAWKLTAVPADGGPDQEVTTPFDVKGTVKSAPIWRDYIASPVDFADLLAVTPGGVADFREGDDGQLDGKVPGAGWTGADTMSAAVPFDDVDGDGTNDVLVRLSSGELRLYKPAGKALTSATPYAKIGGGWNIFDVLTSPGDMTGDGHADVLAREASTGDLYLYEANGSGNFKARVKIGTGWKSYLLAAGGGDLNGDGRADLIARDSSGVLWLYPGTGKGTLDTRVKLGGGWQVYDTLVGVGDMTGDGKLDLVARDTTGVLWSYAADGKGNFYGRNKVGGGWQMYKYLF
ncbi:FG-GAP-like repeat-containing protein [Streptomyces sp. YS-3]|uniref:FG-GAP-like repeat-containing protein n=1 Tax=Streptomyces sp. YS-3 TaxID=3381352 RepID=UPI003862AEEA